MNKHLITLMLLSMAITAEAQNDSLQLREVVVTGTHTAADVRHLPMTVSVVGRELLTEQHQTNILSTVTQQVPGLLVTGRSMLGYGVSGGAAGGISLRGISGGAGQLLVLIDGHPQYSGVYGHPISDSYQTLMAERVEVVRGPASMLYGSNAMGGALNIVTRSMHEDGVRTGLNLGAGSYGTIQAETSNQVRKGKFTSTASAQYARTNNHRPRMGFEQYGGHLRLGYSLNEHWKAYADADITHFTASHPGSVTSPIFGATQWITRGTASAALENHYNRTDGAISIYSTFGCHKLDDGTADASSPTVRYFRSRDALTGLSWHQSARLFEGNRLTFGMDYQHIYGHAYYTSKETGEILDTPNKQSGRSHRNETAGYIDFRQDIAPWLTVDAGIRLDHHSLTGTEWVPQGGLVVRLLQTGELKAMASKGFRNPTMREMYLYPPSNTDLKPERMMNYELSWRHRPCAFSYGINLFYLKGNNMIMTIPVDGRPRNMNTGKIENYGAEVEAAWHITPHWSLNSNHSLLHMKHPVVAAPKYKGFLGANFRYARWSVVAGLQYIDGLYTAVGDNELTEKFLLLNATVSYAATKNVCLWLRGENLLAQHYEYNLGFPMPRATFMGGVSVNL